MTPGLARYTGKVALVTGAGSGIGRATAERIAQEGGAVAVVDIDEGGARKVADAIAADGGRALPLAFDVGDRGAYERGAALVERELGLIDVLVSNAAIGGLGALGTWDAEAFDRVIHVNVLGVLHGMGVVGTRMAERKAGAIVCTTSLAASYGLAGNMPYTISKGGVSALTLASAMELAPHVRVNGVAPGKTLTPMREKMFGAPPTDDEIAAIAATYPLRRVAEPEDIAAAIAFLGSDDAVFITGVILAVDGGLSAGSAGLW
ncbi:MAG: short-chain dehydrogenase/reductase [Actinomycetia bacterium]|nr:short-chain dehydrogenase/reductase [Actinomycetes bacterium]